MESLLSQYRENVQYYADAIHNVLGVDVDIADSGLIRVAGTGIFKESIGTDVLKNAMVIKTVMATKERLIIERPGFDQSCLQCKERGQCREKIEICVPIVNDGQILGGIAIGTSEENIARVIQTNIDNYMAFLTSISELIAAGVMEKSLHIREMSTKKTLEKVINRVDVGILITDEQQQINYINKAAERIIGATKKQLDYLLKINQFQILSSDPPSNDTLLFNIQVRNSRITLTGKISKIDIHEQKIGTLYIFEELIQVQRRRIRETNELFRFSFESVIGSDRQILRAIETGKMIAALDKNVLVTGESGTGKEVFSRAIHQEGPGKNMPLVSVMCASSPELLLEKELFGSEDGEAMGKLALAKGGTLYFDEIADMPISLQSRLMAYLDQQKPDIRIIATTSRDLTKKAEQNLFRSDLLYTIREFEIAIPPVRERTDRDYLLDFFQRKYEIQEDVHINLTDEVISRLKTYDWPGNVREMDSVYSLFAVLSQSNDQIRTDMLPSFLQESTDMNTSYNLKHLEKEMIIKILNLFPNSAEGKKLAAQALGISTASLYRKIQKYQIQSAKTYR